MSFHEFPKDSYVRREWVTKCKKGGVIDANYARVCSEHFRFEEYESNLPNELLGVSHGKFLKYDAVPSLNTPQFETFLMTSSDDKHRQVTTEPTKALASTARVMKKSDRSLLRRKQRGKEISSPSAQPDSLEVQVTFLGDVKLEVQEITVPEIEDCNELSRLCRICGLPSPDVVPLLENGDIFSKIMKCLPAVITKDDKMPKQVCGTCISKVNTSFELLQMFLEAQSHLKALMGIASEEMDFDAFKGTLKCQKEDAKEKLEKLKISYRAKNNSSVESSSLDDEIRPSSNSQTTEKVTSFADNLRKTRSKDDTDRIAKNKKRKLMNNKTLEEKRKIDMERQRRRRAQLSDEQLAKKKIYDREYKARRKEEGTWKTKANMTTRELLKQRKLARERANRYRVKKNMLRKGEETMERKPYYML